MANGRAQLRSYCSGADQVSAWDLGVGCEGQVDILVEPANDSRQRERELLDLDLPFAVCTVINSPVAAELRTRLVVTADGGEGDLMTAEIGPQVVTVAQALLAAREGSGLHDVAGRSVFVDIFFPPPRLVVISAGDDAQPLVRFAIELGFRVTVVDHRPGLLLPERFPGAQLVDSSAADFAKRVPLDETCCVVLMMHHFADDSAYLAEVLRTPATYIGVLGPRQRTDRILTALGPGARADERIHGPVGLDIGTDGAEQVALSVLAEIMAVRSGRAARSLRDRPVPIHANGD